MVNLIPALVFDPLGLLLDGWGLIERGGPVMYVLLALSIAAVAIIALKVWQFTAARLGAVGFVEEAMRHVKSGRPNEALRELAASKNPIARVLEEALTAAMQKDLSAEDRESRVARVGSAQIRRLEGGLRVLEIIGNLSPLLGLLGTVMGMIAAFAALEAAGAKIQPGLLAGGIWEALLTTAFGLTVAIPALAGFYILDGQVERAREVMQEASAEILERLAHGIPLGGADLVGSENRAPEGASAQMAAAK